VIFGHYTAPEWPYPGCSYIARIDFIYGERRFKAGDDFDWRALGLVEEQAVALWRSDHLLVRPRPKKRRAP
jgi:hypothetical protein